MPRLQSVLLHGLKYVLHFLFFGIFGLYLVHRVNRLRRVLLIDYRQEKARLCAHFEFAERQVPLERK